VRTTERNVTRVERMESLRIVFLNFS
jgi:hypothetical protein